MPASCQYFVLKYRAISEQSSVEVCFCYDAEISFTKAVSREEVIMALKIITEWMLCALYMFKTLMGMVPE